MSDYDERYETDRSEDEEEEDHAEIISHKRRLGDAKKWIRNLVESRAGMLAEGARKIRLTEEDVDQFFEEYSDLTQQENENAPTLLHGMVDLVSSDESIDSVTVKALVQRLVQQSTHLLCITNDEHQNPLYLAITKKKFLVDYMVVSCPEEGKARMYLARALEDSRGNEKRKNCLHVAFEKDMRPTTLGRMLKDASTAALEAVDTTGRRPMHYAVRYNQCSVEVIGLFIERDNEAVRSQKETSPNKPPKTFLDVDKDAETSVYQEHIASAPVCKEDARSRNYASENIKKKDKPSEMSEEWAKNARGRNAIMQSKPGTLALADLAHRKMSESTRKFLMRHAQEHGDLELARLYGYQDPDREMSRDRQSLYHEDSHEPVRVQTDVGSADVVKPSSEITANTPKALKRAPTMPGDGSRNKQEGRCKQTAASSKKPRKSMDHEAAARESKTVLRMLKLHYMRTRSIERATLWLYKTNPQDVQIFFDYHQLPTLMKEDLFEKAFQATRFDEVLKFVHFTNVTVIRPPKPNSKNGRPKGGLGRQDMEFFFNFLYKKGVRHILKVVVEESGQSVHSDEAIKNSLDRITVEHLDWRKVDMDPQIICGISSQADDNIFGKNGLEVSPSNQLRHLDLQWSGNSAVLRAWSDPEGLSLLQHLHTINIIVPEDTIADERQLYDSPAWIQQKKTEFEIRLNKHRVSITAGQEIEETSVAPAPRKISVHLRGVHSTTGKKAALGPLQSGATQGAASQKIINTHEWLKCMDAFARNISPLWTLTRANFLDNMGAASVTGLEDEVVVALIDDGVALLDQNFVGRVLEGKTFDYQDGDVDYSDGRVGQSYNSAQGHGTEMARCILRVCPMAKIYPIRLKTHFSDDRTSEIDIESAALAINAALEKKATIISMSWTIPVSNERSPAQERFEAAVREACSRDVIMFCSSPDGGHIIDNNYPSAVQRDKMFRIGAAHDDGLAHRRVGKDVDFIFPGVKVNVNATTEVTGSSVATALAAGLAATIIYCFKISVLAIKTQIQTMGYNEMTGSTFTESTVLKLSKHRAMKAAFGRIGRVNDARFIQIWDTLQSAVQELEDHDTDDAFVKAQSIITLCNKLLVPEVL